MKRAVLSDFRQMTSSRQSPKMSPASAGVDFVPLLEDAPGALVLDEFGSRSKFERPEPTTQLLIVVPSSSSYSGSASHWIAKLTNMLDGLAWTGAPVWIWAMAVL